LRAVGLDLAGSVSHNTGFCLLDEALHSNTSPFHTDREIILETMSANPDVVSIDAPPSPCREAARACPIEAHLIFEPVT